MRTPLEQMLKRIGQRRFALSCWNVISHYAGGLALVSISGALVCQFLASETEAVWQWSGQMLLIAAVIGILLRVVYQLCQVTQQDYSSLAVARSIEAHFPELQCRLLATLQRPARDASRDDQSKALLQPSVLERLAEQDMLQHAVTHRWEELIPKVAIIRRVGLSLISALIALAGLSQWTLPVSGDAAPPQVTTSATGTQPVPLQQYHIEPGHTAVERGQPFTLTVRYTGIGPARAVAYWQPVGTTSDAAISIALEPSLADPVLTGTFPAITESGTYHLELDEQAAGPFQVEAYDLPTLADWNLSITPPTYTGLPKRDIPRATTATLLTGSTIEIQLQTTQPIAQATLIPITPTSLSEPAATPPPQIFQASTADSAQSGCAWSLRWPPVTSGIWQVQLLDQSGRRNRDPIELQLTIVPNRPPELTFRFPGEDSRVSPLEELSIEGTAQDDLGLLKAGIVLLWPDRPPRELVLATSVPGGQTEDLAWLEPLENQSTSADMLVAYHLFAEDLGPDGAVRRTESEMFFAEVRPFEEIFRQLQGMSGQAAGGQSSSEAGNAIEKLIGLQKQIVSATWNASRAQAQTAPADLMQQLIVIGQSQRNALDTLERITADLPNPTLVSAARRTLADMQTAVDQLDQQSTLIQTIDLNPLLSAERRAYQGLLTLRAREHLSMQGGQGGGGSGGGGSASQDQMAQLELSSNENRYESASEQQGTPATTTEARAELKLLEQLKELATRQQAIVDRLKELDAEQRLATEPQQRAQVAEELQRLRDEQRQLLADADSAAEDLRTQLATTGATAASAQLDATRQELVAAAEQLEQGNAEAAAQAGSRAASSLDTLQNKFRQQTAARFAEAMRAIQSQSAELVDQELAIQEQLVQQQPIEEAPRLRPLSAPKQLEQAFAEQQARLEQVTADTRELVLSAETTEPLLAEALHQATQQLAQQRALEQLKGAAAALSNGQPEAAIPLEASAHLALQEFHQKVSTAATSLLGDQVAALKRARDEVASLTAQLDQPSPTGSNSDPGSRSTNGQSATPDGAAAGVASESAAGESGASASPAAAESSSTPTGAQPPGAQPPGGKQGGSQKGGQQGGPGGGGGSVFTSNNFADFADGIRDVETMIDDPALRAQVQQIRGAARSLRAQYNRHAQSPTEAEVDAVVRQPLRELQQRLTEEIARREPGAELVPLDRDPVPAEFRDAVRQYYERLGSGAP